MSTKYRMFLSFPINPPGRFRNRSRDPGRERTMSWYCNRTRCTSPPIDVVLAPVSDQLPAFPLEPCDDPGPLGFDSRHPEDLPTSVPYRRRGPREPEARLNASLRSFD